jgi:hypothetical protein
MDRREFLFPSLAFRSNAIAFQGMASPLRFAHRQANMVTSPGQDVFELASQIPGLSGVQLQMIWKARISPRVGSRVQTASQSQRD